MCLSPCMHRLFIRNSSKTSPVFRNPQKTGDISDVFLLGCCKIVVRKEYILTVFTRLQCMSVWWSYAQKINDKKQYSILLQLKHDDKQDTTKRKMQRWPKHNSDQDIITANMQQRPREEDNQHTTMSNTRWDGFYFFSTLPRFEADAFDLSSSAFLCGHVTLG